MSLLLISFLSGLAVFALITLSKALFGMDNRGCEKAFSVILAILFAVRFLLLKGLCVDLSAEKVCIDQIGIILGNILFWLEITAVLFLLLRPFFNFKTAIWYGKYIPLGIFLLSFIGLPFFAHQLELSSSFAVSVIYAVEVGYGLAISIYHHLNDRGKRCDKSSYLEIILVSIFINIVTMPVNFISQFFQNFPSVREAPIWLSIVFCLLLFAIPFVISCILRKSEFSKIKYFFVLACLAGCLKFVELGSSESIFAFWKWPLNICELSLIVLTIAIIFNRRRLFNLVCVIGLFSCFLALGVPNINPFASLVDANVLGYYTIRLTVFYVASSCLILRVFGLPKLKQVFYATIAFTIYYVFTLGLNIMFKGLEGETFEVLGTTYIIKSSDFLHSNSAYLALRIGLPFEEIFNIFVRININGKVFVLHPVYELIHYWTFVALIFSFYYLYVRAVYMYRYVLKSKAQLKS